MELKALCVDDEPNVLSGFTRTLRRVVKLDTAESGSEALAKIKENGPYAVVVSDMRMPEMDGVELLRRVGECSPDSVRIMLTGNNDQQTAMDAINEGQVFRFLTKPCEPKILAGAIMAGFQHYKLICAEKELLGETLTGAVHALGEMLSMINPVAFGRVSRIERYTKAIADRIGIEYDWQLDILPTLSQIGCIGLSAEIMSNAIHDPENMSFNERQEYEKFPALGARLIETIPRFEEIAGAIRYQLKNYDGSGSPQDGPSGDALPIGARMLRLTGDFDSLIAQGITPQLAIPRIEANLDWYDETMVNALFAYIRENKNLKPKMMPLGSLRPGMVLAEDVCVTGGALLMSNGQTITESSCERLLSFSKNGQIKDSVAVFAELSDESFDSAIADCA